MYIHTEWADYCDIIISERERERPFLKEDPASFRMAPMLVRACLVCSSMSPDGNSIVCRGFMIATVIIKKLL